MADRLPKRRLLVATQSVMCVLALVLAALVHRGHVQYWHVAVMAAIYGVANTVDMPTRWRSSSRWWAATRCAAPSR